MPITVHRVGHIVLRVRDIDTDPEIWRTDPTEVANSDPLTR